MDRTVGNVSDDDVVLIDVSDRVAVVTLNRPDARQRAEPRAHGGVARGDRGV